MCPRTRPSCGPTTIPAVADEVAARARRAGAPGGGPATARARPPRGQRVAISVCDVTRPQPRSRCSAAIAEALDGVIRPDDVVVLIATGRTARAPTNSGGRCSATRCVERWRVVDHDARDAARSVDFGVVDGRPGHPQPRVARGRRPDHDRVRRAALLRRVQRRPEDGRARALPRSRRSSSSTAPGASAIRGRPSGSSRATRSTMPSGRSPPRPASTSRSTCLIDGQQRITQAFGGRVLEMHAVARRTARGVAMRPVTGPFDIVITTNSGYPLDQNLYQAVKGMAAAATVVATAGPSSAPLNAVTACPMTATTRGCCEAARRSRRSRLKSSAPVGRSRTAGRSRSRPGRRLVPGSSCAPRWLTPTPAPLISNRLPTSARRWTVFSRSGPMPVSASCRKVRRRSRTCRRWEPERAAS